MPAAPSLAGMQKTLRTLGRLALPLLPVLIAGTGCAGNPASLTSLAANYAKSYAVVVSKETYADPAWKKVADTLVRKHNGTLIIYADGIESAREKLAETMPRYTAFVVTPEETEAGENKLYYLPYLDLLVRELDDDPYADTLYGIVTGQTAADALTVAVESNVVLLKKSEAGAGKKENEIRVKNGEKTVQAVVGNAEFLPQETLADTFALWQTPPGRNSLAESFFFAAPKFDPANGILRQFPVATFYGDPARDVVVEATENSFISGGIASSGNTHVFTLTINDYPRAALNNTPVGVIFTQRIKNPKIISGQAYEPILADNFILLKKPQPRAGEKTVVVEFEGEPIE